MDNLVIFAKGAVFYIKIGYEKAENLFRKILHRQIVDQSVFSHEFFSDFAYLAP